MRVSVKFPIPSSREFLRGPGMQRKCDFQAVYKAENGKGRQSIKMKRPFLLIRVILCALLLSPVLSLDLSAESGYSPQLGSYLHSMTKSEPPRIISGYMVLTYSSNHPVRYVAAAFGHEDFARFHIYEKNQNGVFLLAAPLPEGVTTLTYRIIVDGLWMKDPGNNMTVQDSRGIPISAVSLPSWVPERGESPLIHADGTVEFVRFGNPGDQVTLAGDFNHWSPFSHIMRESAPGEYRIRLRLYDGFHRYAYYVNGTAVTDPLNPKAAYDVFGHQVSGLTVPFQGEENQRH